MANTHLGRISIAPQSNRKAWWRSGMCKTRQSHRWQASIQNRSNGASCPYNTGRAGCPWTDLAHNHPEVAAEWDWEANGERTPETVTAGSHFKAAWRCGLCGHSWSASVLSRTQRRGCPHCAHEARRIQTRQPSISDGAPHLLAQWDWEANTRRGWHAYRVTLRPTKNVHWVVKDECKLGLVHRWRALPDGHTGRDAGSPFPSGTAVCACNSLAVQCVEAADLWDFPLNGGLTPNEVAVQSNKLVTWKGPDGRQWQQVVKEVVNNTKRRSTRARLGYDSV